MKCPKCGAENPEGSNFCQECGVKLSQVDNCSSKKLMPKYCKYIQIVCLIATIFLFLTSFIGAIECQDYPVLILSALSIPTCVFISRFLKTQTRNDYLISLFLSAVTLYVVPFVYHDDVEYVLLGATCYLLLFYLTPFIVEYINLFFMKCPKCGAENPEGSLLCQECGEKLVVVKGEGIPKYFKVLSWINLCILFALFVLSCLSAQLFLDEDGQYFRYVGDPPIKVYIHSEEAGFANVFAGMMFLGAAISTILFLGKSKRNRVIYQLVFSVIALLSLLLSLFFPSGIQSWPLIVGALIYVCFMVILPCFCKG